MPGAVLDGGPSIVNKQSRAPLSAAYVPVGWGRADKANNKQVNKVN